MTDPHPQCALLIAYADGNANPKEQAQAIELINSDAEAHQFYQKLHSTSQLGNMLSEQRQPAVPEHLIEQIKASTIPVNSRSANNSQPAASIQSHSTVTSAPHNSSSNTATPILQTRQVNPKRFSYLALAASLFCGLAAGPFLYRAAISSNAIPDRSFVSARAEIPEWIRLVADYHRLYVRETLAASAVISTELVSQEVSETLQHQLNVPALENQGMEFRRAQWLAIDKQPLLQLAYLPEKGKPLAVCVLKTSLNQNTAPEYGQTDGMQYVHWQRGRHAVVIVGTVTSELLEDINHIVENEIFPSSSS
ncbi:hypothetical protein AB833_02170 [Chromatiales bacterium (ex Bugula neritina AB1)]|nr:hypothetical protein AB833_02170 [Chromatiales bacterium (ex Bugula neritina AB1)]